MNRVQKEIYCFFHIGGKIVTDQGKTQYVGGRANGRMVREGMSLNDVRRTICSCLGIKGKPLQLRCTLSLLDESTIVDIEDDEGVQQLVQYNDKCAHLYIVEDVSILIDEEQSTIISERLETMEGSHGLCNVGSSSSSISEDQPYVIQSSLTPIPKHGAEKWKGLLSGPPKRFTNAVEFKEALYKYSLAHKFAYKYVSNCASKMIVRCKVEGCPWKITAYQVEEECSFLRVRTFVEKHNHSAQDDLIIHRKMTSTLTASIIKDGLRGCLEKPPHEIRREVYREYGLTMSYDQAWKGKEKALAEIQGAPEQSYMLIPWYCKRVMEVDPRTVAKWEACADHTFTRLFIAYGCSVEGFFGGCRPIIYCDGTHLSGPYRGTMLSASALDADNQLYPIAYAIVGGETNDDWTWFMHNMKDILNSVEVVIVSDRHNAIIHAVRYVFGSERHAYCYRHVKENFSSEYSKVHRGGRRNTPIKKEDALKMLDGIAYARVPCDFERAVANMGCFNRELLKWLEEHGDMDRWALSQFPFRRWENITTNLAESYNAWLVKERKHHVLTLINEHRQKLAKKLFASKNAIKEWKNGVGPNIEAKLKQNVLCATRMVVLQHSAHTFEVQIGEVRVGVNLAMRECACKAWEMSGIPCSHACACIKLVNGNVYRYVEECYLSGTQEKIYNTTMTPMNTHDMPKLNELRFSDYENEIFLWPPMTSRRPGRPRTSRRESQLQDKKVYTCSRCGQEGHTRRRCRNPNPY